MMMRFNLPIQGIGHFNRLNHLQYAIELGCIIWSVCFLDGNLTARALRSLACGRTSDGLNKKMRPPTHREGRFLIKAVE